MWRRFIVAGVAFVSFFPASAQITKQFAVEDRNEIDKVDFSLKVNGGYYTLQSGILNNDLINIYTNENLENYSHKYNKVISDKICNVSLALEDIAGGSLSQKISYQMFGSDKKETDKVWKVLLNSGKPYRLNLNYGVGMANIDLTGLAIENLKVHSGNADVKIEYNPATCNTIEMDTFYVKVDLGSVVVKRMNLCKSKYIHADVGFGNMLLDFSDNPVISSDIKGSVGAGNLMIILPEEEIPVMIRFKDSWLCKVKLTDNFTKISENTYVNASYKDNATNLLSFDLDVSMGSIIFKEKE